MDEFEKLKDHFIDVLDQACGSYNKEKDVMEYDHCCLSAYESALHYAVHDMGWIEESQLTRGL